MVGGFGLRLELGIKESVGMVRVRLRSCLVYTNACVNSFTLITLINQSILMCRCLNFNK